METHYSPHDIGKSKYKVIYRRLGSEEYYMFVGVCENFCTVGKSAFWNEELEQMLLIDYLDIINLYPL